MMRQRFYLLFCFMLIYASFAYTQGNESLAFEQAKLQMLCEAIRFNYKYQGQASYVKTLDCRSLQALGNSLPSRFKSSTRLYNTYARRSYEQLTDLESRLEKLQKDLIAELEGIGQIAHGNDSKKLQIWNDALRQLNREFDIIRSNAIRQQLATEKQAPFVHPKENDVNEPSEISAPEQEAVNIAPISSQKTAANGYHGLWIISILSAFVALAAAGTAYVIHVRSKSEIAALREMVYERYNLLDRRFDLFYQQLLKQKQPISESTQKGEEESHSGDT
ncbi:hypothetical protein FHS56_002178 [Thermonema lapsum]|uniref:Uncharacterized protein n=1 Tax=Thermonema lapsum TaxID=28195 RepID=A0A846MT79_9BACT|nr:hypothetical protein [Thermonema lapsum]NIK74649.1 hypothetical protein [Thermonema lapsum]